MGTKICEVCGSPSGKPHRGTCPFKPDRRRKLRLIFSTSGETYHQVDLPILAARELLLQNGVKMVYRSGTDFPLYHLTYAECARSSRAFSGKTENGGEVLITAAT